MAAKKKPAAPYVVVARRYRPQTFEDLVGQDQVVRALTNAIATNRVGHAYLFTGARGVGKTSTARIFAKALNCEKGPTATPCNQCDICKCISSGEDVDVLEIDGASNRGIDEIRQLRSNVGIRPSRERFKIYIIDEVHMLTTQAFNALLKTLEEPPEHVKFIFCTTDPEKVPITVRSRCQRFDFAPAPADAIYERLKQITDAEKVKADPEALRTLARRAEGSMRDSQSLLEQLLAFSGDHITLESVHQLLGTASSGRLGTLIDHLAERNAAGALAELDAATQEGVDMGQLAEQLAGWMRDMMAAVVGCPPDLMRHTAPGDYDELLARGRKFGLQTILAMSQILDQTLVRLRHSTLGRMLVELAIVRICHLENLDQLSDLIAQVQQGASAPQKKSEPIGKVGTPVANNGADRIPRAETAPKAMPSSSEAPAASARPWEDAHEASTSASQESASLTAESAPAIWQQALSLLEDMTHDFAAQASSVATLAPNRLAVRFPAKYTLAKEQCERAERRRNIEEAVSQAAGGPVKLEFEVLAEEASETPRGPSPQVSRHQQIRKARSHPLVQEAMRLFDGDAMPID